jgi:hypothetical protein
MLRRPLVLALTLVAIGLSLSGCKTQEERLALQANKDHQACADMGYEKGTSLYLQCRQMQTNNRMAETMRTDAASDKVGRGLQRAGAALQSVGKGPETTSCRRTISGYDCTTF